MKNKHIFIFLTVMLALIVFFTWLMFWLKRESTGIEVGSNVSLQFVNKNDDGHSLG